MSKSAMVLIGCKHPTGLQLIINFGKEGDERKVVIAGANQGEFRQDGLLIPKTVGGFGRTAVSREFWDEWKRQNPARAEEWQAKGFLFVVEDTDLFAAQANDKAGSVTGFEPLRLDQKGELADSRAKAIAPDISANPDFANKQVA